MQARRVNLSGMTGRGLRAPTDHLPRKVRELGGQQELAHYEAGQQGKQLLWRRYPRPVERMNADEQLNMYLLCDNYSNHNTTRKVGDVTWWWLRCPDGMLSNEPGFMEVPDEMPTIPVVAETKPTDLDPEEKRAITDAITAAFDAGLLPFGTPEYELAARVGTALHCGKPLTEALPVHLAGGNRGEVRSKVIALVQVVPEVEKLTKVC